MSAFTLSQLDAMPVGYTVTDTDLLLLTIGTEIDSLSSVKISTQQFAAYSAAAGTGWTDDGTVVRTVNATDKVGIGTTTPNELLTVAGNISARDNLYAGSNVGIGTTTPSNPLTVYTGENGLGISAYHTTTTSSVNLLPTNTYWGAKTPLIDMVNATTTTGTRLIVAAAESVITFNDINDNADFQFGTQATKKFVIKSNGNVGIGTTAPTRLLHLSGGGDSYEAGIQIKNGSSYEGDIYMGTGGGLAATNMMNFRIGNTGAGQGVWMWSDHTANPRMTLTNTGLGIGTAAPGALLDIHGSDTVAQLESSTSQVLLHFQNSGSGAYEGIGSTGNRLSLFTANVERVSVDTSGKVGIGTTEPAEKLTVAGCISAQDCYKFADGTSQTTAATSTSVPANSARQEFTANGTWYKPTGVTLIKVWVFAGGGGQAGHSSSYNQSNAGPYGGTGGTGHDYIDVTNISTVAVTVGAKGTGGEAGAGGHGTAGGDSSFGTYITADGGGGGQSAGANGTVGFTTFSHSTSSTGSQQNGSHYPTTSWPTNPDIDGGVFQGFCIQSPYGQGGANGRYDGYGGVGASNSDGSHGTDGGVIVHVIR